MCELLLCWRDQVSSDFYANCALPKAGDVITVQDDGHGWGGAEMTNPNWRIIALPGVAQSAVTNLLQGEISTTVPPVPPAPFVLPRTLQYRGFALGKDALTKVALVAAFLNDDTRAKPRYTWTGGLAVVTAAIAKRPAIADPAVIGSP